MSYLLDTNIVIHLRNGDRQIVEQLAGLAVAVSICVPTLVELQPGLVITPELEVSRRAGLERILARFAIKPLNETVIDAYGSIIATIGYSRTRIFDRLIAATAIVHDLTLVTINGPNFRDIPGLKLEVWPAPAQ